MKTAQIEIGKTYLCKVSGKLTRVKVFAKRQRTDPVSGRALPPRFECCSWSTDRQITATAARLLREVPAPWPSSSATPGAIW